MLWLYKVPWNCYKCSETKWLWNRLLILTKLHSKGMNLAKTDTEFIHQTLTYFHICKIIMTCLRKVPWNCYKIFWDKMIDEIDYWFWQNWTSRVYGSCTDWCWICLSAIRCFHICKMIMTCLWKVPWITIKWSETKWFMN